MLIRTTSYALSLCLLAAATSVAGDPVAGTARQRARAPVPRVREVRFAGDAAFAPDVLRNVLRSTRMRRWIPGIWTARPPYAAAAVDDDLARLRSFYLANGYVDAQVAVAAVTTEGRDATVTVDARAGSKYGLRKITIAGVRNEDAQIAADAKGASSVDALCTRLLDLRRVAEADGRIDFAVALEVTDAAPPAPAEAGAKWADLTARVRMGSAHAVGRIEFSGNRRISDATLRRATGLRERSGLDLQKLRGSLARLNRSGLIEPLTPQDITIKSRTDTATVDLMISVRERRGGRWSLSGPLGLGVGSLQATVSSRLPGWGHGVLEASTYYATFSVIGVANPLLRLVPVPFTQTPKPLLALERPDVPGQSLFSGFALSPQLSLHGMLASYALRHVDGAVQTALAGSAPEPDLVVPMFRVRDGTSSSAAHSSGLICSPAAPSYRWLRRGAAIAADVALGQLAAF
jgi:hypothetical protein